MQGIATSTAKEIVSAYKGNEPIDGEDFFNHLNDFLFNTPSNPCVLLSDGEIKDVCAFNYKNQSGEILPFDNLYQAEEYYFSKRNA